MKNFRFYLNLLLSIGVLLLVIAVGQSYLEYRSSRAAVLSLFRSQAQTMIAGIAKAGEKGLIAYQSLQDQTMRRLFTIANTVDIFYSQNILTLTRLNAIANDNQLAELIIFNNNNRPIMTYPMDLKNRINAAIADSILQGLSNDNTDRQVIGFAPALNDSGRVFSILYKGPDKTSVLVAIDATGLQNQRRAFGAGSIIEDMSQSSNVKYAGIINNNMILVATRNFPFEQFDNWLSADSARGDTIVTRVRDLRSSENGSENVFEAAGPFDVAGQYYGEIVIGLDTSFLNLLTSKLKRDVFWHTLLGLLITLIAVTGVVIWNNFKLVSSQYGEIKNEVQKLEADKAVKARLASMGELAGGVAHEIRNPLNAIRVIVQRLQREFTPGEDKEEYIELTNVVKRETDRINESIKQFLKMARPPVLEKHRGNLNDCIAKVLELFEPRAGQQHISIVRNFGKLAEFDLDSKLCSQAILNILENAVDAIAENGEIEITTYMKAKRAIAEIKDTGPGISSELKGRVFDMYFTTKDSGTGMGLPSVLMTVKEHGGSVEILDNPSGGAIFRLEFPVE